MSRDHLALARALPPGVVARRAFGLVSRPLVNALARRRDLARPTYHDGPSRGPLAQVVDRVPFEALRPQRTWIEAAAERYREHRFDLLGSGWVRVAHGIECRGVDGTRLPALPPVAPDPDGGWLVGRINAANLAASRAIWRLVDPGYAPIDWQLDFKTGFRWSEHTWSGDLAFGEAPNVDVKVPWELARLQHLTILAWAHALARDADEAAAAEEWWREYRNQTLDFIATNPPRFGANWRCTMDVAIRGANLVLAHGLFAAAGAAPDRDFDRVLAAAIDAHARHVLDHLEWHPEGRGNHYLADVAGLAFLAAALPESGETNTWLAFALQEVVGETSHQFHPDGTNFEGSTAYHRLSGEASAYATALAVGLGERLARAQDGADPALLRSRPGRPIRARWRLDEDHIGRFGPLAEFTAAITKDDGRIPQIGDNDGGRFFKPHPKFSRPDDLDEDTLDHRGFVAAAATLAGRGDLRGSGGPWIDAALVEALMRRSAPPPVRRPWVSASVRRGPVGRDDPTPPARTIVIQPPRGASLRHGLRLHGWPDFGLWLFRSDRVYLAVRCGRSAHNLANHAHNDQLAIELAIDGVDWLADPGSYLYAPPRPRRDAWRSVAAHAAPRWEAREPASLTVGNFCLPPSGDGKCLRFADGGFAGEHLGYGRPVRREIELGDLAITVRDYGLPSPAASREVRCADPRSTREAFGMSVPVSFGYGRLAPASRQERDS
jgi:hypothetical protein